MKNKIGYIIVAILAVLIGLYPAIYFFVQQKFGLLQSKSNALLADSTWNAAFYTHITLGGLALLIGWIQFNNKLRRNKPQTHRMIGKVYVVAVLLSAMAAVYISFFATGGLIPATGFAMLGMVWFTTTLAAFVFARRQEFSLHGKMMVYSYASCFAAVTLRMYLPLLTMAFGDFIPAYKIVAWLCWVPNLVVAWRINKNMKDEILPLSKYSVNKAGTDLPVVH